MDPWGPLDQYYPGGIAQQLQDRAAHPQSPPPSAPAIPPQPQSLAEPVVEDEPPAAQPEPEPEPEHLSEPEPEPKRHVIEHHPRAPHRTPVKPKRR